MNEKQKMYKRYKEFLEENFNKSILLDLPDLDLKPIIYKINDLYILTVCCVEFDLANNIATKELILNLKEYIRRILFIIPLNDKLLIGYLYRLITEYLYRIIYSVYFDESTQSIIKMYKKDVLSALDSIVEDNIKNLLSSNYSMYSEVTHGSYCNQPISSNIFELQKNIDRSILKFIDVGLDDTIKVFIDGIFNILIDQNHQNIEIGLKKKLRDNLNRTRLSMVKIDY